MQNSRYSLQSRNSFEGTEFETDPMFSEYAYQSQAKRRSENHSKTSGYFSSFPNTREQQNTHFQSAWPSHNDRSSKYLPSGRKECEYTNFSRKRNEVDEFRPLRGNLAMDAEFRKDEFVMDHNWNYKRRYAKEISKNSGEAPTLQSENIFSFRRPTITKINPNLYANNSSYYNQHQEAEFSDNFRQPKQYAPRITYQHQATDRYHQDRSGNPYQGIYNGRYEPAANQFNPTMKSHKREFQYNNDEDRIFRNNRLEDGEDDYSRCTNKVYPQNPPRRRSDFTNYEMRKDTNYGVSTPRVNSNIGRSEVNSFWRERSQIPTYPRNSMKGHSGHTDRNWTSESFSTHKYKKNDDFLCHKGEDEQYYDQEHQFEVDNNWFDYERDNQLQFEDSAEQASIDLNKPFPGINENSQMDLEYPETTFPRRKSNSNAHPAKSSSGHTRESHTIGAKDSTSRFIRQESTKDLIDNLSDPEFDILKEEFKIPKKPAEVNSLRYPSSFGSLSQKKESCETKKIVIEKQRNVASSLTKEIPKKESCISEIPKNFEITKPSTPQLKEATRELTKSSLQQNLFSSHSKDTKRAVTFDDVKENYSFNFKENEETPKVKTWLSNAFETPEKIRSCNSNKMSEEDELHLPGRKNSNSCTTQDATETQTMSSDIKNSENKTDYDSNSNFTAAVLAESSDASNSREDENTKPRMKLIDKLQSRKSKPRAYNKRGSSHDEAKKPKKKKTFEKYSEAQDIISTIHNFDFTDKRSLNSLSNPLNNMTGAGFWFYLCSQYFPRAPFTKHTITQLFEEIDEELEEIALDSQQPKIAGRRATMSKGESKALSDLETKQLARFRGAIKDKIRSFKLSGWATSSCSEAKHHGEIKSVYDIEDDQWLLELRALVNEFAIKNIAADWSDNLNLMKKIELTDLITVLETEQSDKARQNKEKLDALKRAAKEVVEEESVLCPKKQDLEDLLVDIRVKFPEEESYLSYMDQRQRNPKTHRKIAVEGKLSLKALKALAAECDCQICNDGDYTEGNKIVFCSKCNLSVHQKCYGIAVIPKDDWICELCQTFGPQGRVMRCPLCPNRAGALKPTTLAKTTNLFKDLNPQFHEFLQSYSPTSGSQRDGENHKAMTTSDKNFDEHLEQGLFYNFYCDVGKPSERDMPDNEPKPANVWVHISCIQFIPELEFEDKSARIAGLEYLINTERSSEMCDICRQKGAGVIVTCGKEGCLEKFHPECAVREGYEIRIQSVNGKNFAFENLNPRRKKIFVAYCPTHRKSRLLSSMIEAREQTHMKEIRKFAKFIQRHHEQSLPEERCEAVETKVCVKKPRSTRKVKEETEKDNSIEMKKDKVDVLSRASKPKTQEKTKEKKKDTKETKKVSYFVKTVGARKAEKSEKKIIEKDTIIRKTNPKPLTSKKFCCVCLSYKLNDSEYVPIVECCDCQKSYHLACLGITESLEVLMNFKCSGCRENVDEEGLNLPQSRTTVARVFEKKIKENNELEKGEASADFSANSIKRRNPFLQELGEENLSKKVKTEDKLVNTLSS